MMALLLLSMTIMFVSGPSPVLAGDDERFLSCSDKFDCGDIRNIGYPFRRIDRPEHCGYPGFQLNCSGKTPVITINQLTYNVINIDGASRTLAVARADYSGGICPSKLVNTTLDFNLFAYSGEDQNITLYYGCLGGPNPPPLISGQSPPDSESSRSFTCTINQVETLGFYLTFLGGADEFLELCKHKVFVPVYKTAIPSIGNALTDVVKAFELGFGIWWSDNVDAKCHACLNSGGKCGYNITAGVFACYCSDQAYEDVCGTGTSLTNQLGEQNGKSSSKVPIGVGIGIAGAVVVGAFLGIWFFVIIRRRKRTFLRMQSGDTSTPPSSKGLAAPQPKLSQSTPSYPSAKSDLGKGSTYFGVQMFEYSELEEATDGFNPSRELGDGGFGIVYYGVLKDGRAVAVKRLYDNNVRRAEQFMNEVEILARLRHKNLVTLFGCTSRRSQELLLVYEYIPNGTVADHLHGRRSNSVLLPWPVRLSIAIETADALAYLHGVDVIHRDVKSNNILLDNNFSVKVADFGLSRLFPTNATHVSTAPQGTPGYVDPEYYECYQLTDKSDVYSFGVVLIELISSLQAVDTTRHRLDINLGSMAINKIQNHALNELVDPSLGFEKDHAVRSMVISVAELAFRCLQQERDMRPTMAEALAALRRIQNGNYGAEKVLVVDVREDDVGLLKHTPLPLVLSPDTLTEKWASDSTLPTTDSSSA